MTDNVYRVGDPVAIEATFTPAPPSATAEVRAPNGTVSAPVVTDAGAGRFTAQFTASQGGLWWYAFHASTGASVQNSVYVEPVRTGATGYSLLADYALITLEDAREFVYNDPTDDRADDRLERRINEYSRAVSTFTKHEWMPAVNDATRRIWYDARGFLSLAPWDARVIDSVTMFANYPLASQVVLAPGSTTVTGEYFSHVDPDLGVIQWLDLPLAGITNQVEIVGDWGIGLVPEDVQLAVKIAVRNAIENPVGYQTRAYGETQLIEAGAFEEAGRAGGNLPPEARALLAPYRRGFVFVA